MRWRGFVELPGAVIGGLGVLLSALVVASRFIKDLEPLGKLSSAVWQRFKTNRDEDRLSERYLVFISKLRRRIKQDLIDPEWEDERFADLDTRATLRRARRRGWLPALPGSGGRRLHLPLSKAMAALTQQAGAEALILLEGEPGSGKIVALRHLALQRCGQLEARRRKGLIPVYVNLRRLETSDGRQVESWVRQFTADGWDRLLVFDAACLDALGQIVEQRRLLESSA